MTEQVVAPALVNIDWGCRFLGIGRTQLFALLGDGSIESVKIGKRRLIPIESLETYVESLRKEAAGM